MENEILGNSIDQWIRAAAVFITVFFPLLAMKVIARNIHSRLLKHETESTNTKVVFFGELSRIKVYIAAIVALHPAIISLKMPARIDEAMKFVFIVAVFVQLAIWANNILNTYSLNYVRKNLEKDPTSLTAVNVFSLMWRVAVFSVLVLLMLDQLGFNITALIAGLGVGGIAVAFALQNVLSDVFGSLAIIFDKPFVVGNTIRIGEFIGRVENVGLKTTRLRSTNGEQLVFSNTELLKMTIQNYGDMNEKRVCMTVGVVYETPYEKLKKIPDIIRNAVFSQKNVSVDHVTLKQLADSSLNFEVWYYIQEQDKTKWFDIEHNVNLEIVRLFENEGISFAYPTRTVYTKSF